MLASFSSMFYFSRFCKETIAQVSDCLPIKQFYFSRFCKETIAVVERATRGGRFYFSRFCKETIAVDLSLNIFR